MGTLYDTDIVAWAAEQAELLRARKFDQLDLDNIAEEIEGAGRHEKRELRSRLAVLIAHLLKWQFQPTWRCHSWQSTADTQREEIADLLQQNPSLHHLIEDPDFLRIAWKKALSIFERETGLHGPADTPLWAVEDLLDPRFFP